jgi:hypothetical protein
LQDQTRTLLVSNCRPYFSQHPHRSASAVENLLVPPWVMVARVFGEAVPKTLGTVANESCGPAGGRGARWDVWAGKIAAY